MLKFKVMWREGREKEERRGERRKKGKDRGRSGETETERQ